MEKTFQYAGSFNHPLNWDTSKVTQHVVHVPR